MPTIGQTLAGRYRIDERIGSGGFATVYRAHDSRLDRDVAVKVLLPNHAADPVIAERFDREARTLAALNHPNVVAIHDVEPGNPETGEEPFLVMELCDGGSLADRLAAAPDGRLPPDELVPILVDVAAGLEALHQRGIVHRDVKPSNILLSDGRARLADLGVAAAGPSDLTAPGTALGTLGFLGPELLAGKPAHLSSDVHALGAVAYLGLTGQLPRPADSVAAVVEASRRPVTPISAVAPSLGEAFDAPVAAALAPDPGDRPTPAEFGDSLTAALEASGAASEGGPASVLAVVGAGAGRAASSAGAEAPTEVDLRAVTAPPIQPNRPEPSGVVAAPEAPIDPWPTIAVAVIVGALVIAAALFLVGGIGLPGAAPANSGGSGGIGPSPSVSEPSSSTNPSLSPSPSASGPAPTSAAYGAAAAASSAMRDAIEAARGGRGGLKGKDANDLLAHLDRFDQALAEMDAAMTRKEADAVATKIADIVDKEDLGADTEAALTGAATRLVRAADALPGG